MFNFDMFSMRYWNLLLHAQLRGFGGFVFGLLILAALPLYTATTAIILRTKKPLITIPVPKLIKDLYAPTPATPTTKEAAPDEPPTEDTTSVTPPKKKEYPSEMRGMFINARNTINSITIPTPATAHEPAAPAAEPSVTDDFPLPTDFDIPVTFESDTTMTDAPTFSEIQFDDDAPQPAPPQPHTPDDYTAPVCEYLRTVGRDFTIDGDIVICDNMAIGAHFDPDFWIADDTDWFAPEKQRPSPIAALVNMAKTRDLRPVLYISKKNILDFDDKIDQWQQMGIHIINDLSEIDTNPTPAQ